MDLTMPEYLGRPASLEENSGYTPPAFEIGRALEHYRKSKKKPFPTLMKTKYFYQEYETSKTDEEGDTVLREMTSVWLCGIDGEELAEFTFCDGRMKVKYKI